MTNSWLDRRILNWAHQGGAWEGPSSTMYALEQAVKAGAHAIELDVHCTLDRHLVVCHDATVDRTTQSSGAIASLTLAEVQALDNAYWWVGGSDVDHDAPADAYVHRGAAPTDRRFGVATLDEVLSSFPGVFLNFDIKQTSPAVEPYETLLADALRRHSRADDVIVASFNDAATQVFSAYVAEISTSMGTKATYDFYQAVKADAPPPTTNHVALQVPFRFEEITLVDEAFVAAAHRHGIAVHVWTINDEADMAALIDLDVDGIITDRPAALGALLADRAVGYSA